MKAELKGYLKLKPRVQAQVHSGQMVLVVFR
jgi:hypothetical protein